MFEVSSTAHCYPGETHAVAVSSTLGLANSVRVEVVRRPMSPDDRLETAQNLNAVPAQQFNMLVFALNPPPGLIPPMPAPRGDRSHALLEWAESPGGCGLIVVKDYLTKVLSPR